MPTTFEQLDAVPGFSIPVHRALTEHILLGGTFLYLRPAEEAARTEAWLYEGRERSGVDPHEILRAFTDRTDRVLGLLDGFMPECAWLDDSETLTYLHSTVSTKRYRVRVPETPIYLDVLLADQPLTGGLEPRLGDQHLRILTIVGFPTSTTPGLLDDLNRLAFPYRWSTRAILLDKTDATRLLTKIRRQWFAKRKSIAAILKEVMTNEQSVLVDTDAANKSRRCRHGLAGAWGRCRVHGLCHRDHHGLGRRSAPCRRKAAAGREGHPGSRFHRHGRDGQCRRCLARLTAGTCLGQHQAAHCSHHQPGAPHARFRGLGR